MVKNPSSSMPSLAALLGLVAVAGYKNRDKIGDFIKTMTAGAAPSGSASTTAGQAPSGGLGDLVDSFRTKGLGDIVDSWVGTGANKPDSETQMSQGIDTSIIDALAAQTGLSREELLKRLAQVLPQVVDGMTPQGRMPG
ncbi:MAG TPA: YidB family protein [Aestuariivirga sp.]|nr:YidB family protein [Aestuariivirga sp.]